MPKRFAAATSAVVSLTAVGGLVSPAVAADSTKKKPHTTTLNVLAVNDFHGHIDDNGAALACLVEQHRKALGKNTTLVSSGDNIGASPFTSASAQDVPTMTYLRTLGVSVSTVGNHEFDKGYADIVGRVAKTEKFPTLGANVYRRGTQRPALREYTIQKINGVRVAFVGAVTKDTPNIVMLDGIKDVSFGDPVEAVNRVAAKLKDGKRSNGEADVVVASYHAGAGVSAPATYDQALASDPEFNDIATKTSGSVDAILNAHTHQSYVYTAPKPGGGTRPIIQGSSYGKMLSEVSLDYDRHKKKVTGATATNTATKGVDTAACAGDRRFEQAKKIIDAAVADAKTTGSTVVGSATGDLLRNGAESPLANLDAQVWLDQMNAAGRPGADIGLMNPGGVRIDLPYAPSTGEKPGEITYAEAFSVNPFGNTLQVVTLTGAQFKTLLEQQWTGKSGDQVKPQLGLSNNVHYTYDATKPEGSRVVSITVGGKPIDPNGNYKVTSGSFLIGGGDGYTVLKEGTNKVDTGLVDGAEFVAWLKAHSPVTPDTTKRGEPAA